MKKICLFLLAISLMVMSCEKGQPLSEEFPQKIILVLIAQGELYGDVRESITEQNLVITTQEEWTNLIDAMRLENSSVTNIAETDIDFTQYQVIAAFGKVKENGGWSIDVTNIMEYSDSIVATYTNIETGNLVDAIAQPFQIVKIPTSTKNIIFPDTGIIVYKSCCDEERDLSGLNDLDSFRKGEAYLFKDSIPEQMKYIDSYSQPGLMYWIIFDSKTDSACLTVKEKALRWYCGICNFPDFVKEWDIPENGCKVYYEGRVYESCKGWGGVAMISYCDYVLTDLKRK